MLISESNNAGFPSDWNSGVARYDLYASENGGAYSVINSSLDTVFTHTNLTSLSNYCYVVKAVSNDGIESLSNKVCKKVYQPALPTITYLQSASVVAPNQIEVDLKVTTNGQVSEYNLYRSVDELTGYEFIDQKPPGSQLITFTDYNVSTSDLSYYYKIIIEDSCGNTADSTNIAETILLTTSSNSTDMTNLLQWNAYK